MVEICKNKIVFIGLDQKVFHILANSKNYNLVAVNFIPDFLTYKSLNPIDYLFKLAYQFRNIEKFYLAETMLTRLFNLLSFASSKLFHQYADYLNTLCKNKITIIDFRDDLLSTTFLKNNGIDLCVVSNWWLLPLTVIKAPKLGTINIHPSKLPQYRGSVPTLWSLKNFDTKTAVTFMLLDASMDGGDIISQYSIPITKDDSSLTLEHKCDHVIKKNLDKDIQSYICSKLKPKLQDKSKVSKTAKYYEYMKIDWYLETGRDIVNKINLYPYLWPADKCYFNIGKRKVLVENANFIQVEHKKVHGCYTLDKSNLIYYCNDGVVKIRLFRDINLPDSLYFIFNQ